MFLAHLLITLNAVCGPGANVPVTFRITVPNSTPAMAGIFLAGGHSAFGSWKPDGLKLTRGADGRYQATVQLPLGSQVEYKVPLGSWATVEKNNHGADVPNRRLQVDRKKTVQLTIEAWGKDLQSGRTSQSTITGQVRMHRDFASRVLNNRRTLAVYLPPAYEKDNSRYPVLYMHDGQNLFDSATSFLGVEWKVDEHAESLIAKRRIQPLIIVGIYNNADRTREYTPTADPDHGGGGGHAYLRFIVEEVKPFIDRTYRTRKDRLNTAIAGSSLGGLISLHACRTYPDVFSMCGAVSPALMWNEGRLLRECKAESGWMKQTRFWLDMGTHEGRGVESFRSGIERCRQLRAIFKAAGLVPGRDYYYQEIHEGEHNEAHWARRFDELLLFFFATPKQER